MDRYPHIFTPLKVAGLTLKNRLLSAPTSLAELSPESRLTPENILYYRLRAAGGCCAVIIGDAIAHGDTGIAHPRQAALDDHDLVPSLVQAVDAIHAHDCAAGIQIDHGGGLAESGFVKRDGGPRGPSDYVQPWGEQVYGLSLDEIYEIVEAFGNAAMVAKSSGFDMIQLHSGHGWLLHQFISPVTNTRTDDFGGSFEKRMRFPLMVLERMRQAVGKNFPIEVRISADERISDEMPEYSGYGFETGLRIAEMYDGKADLIHVSVGNNNDWESAMFMISSCFTDYELNAAYAAEIKKHVKTPVTCVGAWTDVERIERFLEQTEVDAVSLGRALVADPFLPKKARAGHASDITNCLRCNECVGSMYTTRTIRCTVNPLIGREREYFNPLPQALKKKKILIAGGGPAGLTAAIESAGRGHDVILCEQKNELGGTLHYADGVDFKEGVERLYSTLIRRAESVGVSVMLGIKVDARLAEEIKPDVIIAAVGGLPVIPPISGIDSPEVLKSAHIRKETPIGDNVVIIGGGLAGMEIALHLSEESHKVTVIEMLDEIAPDTNPLHRSGLLWRMKGNENLKVETCMRCVSVEKTGRGFTINAIDTSRATHAFPSDTVILAAGLKANTEQAEALRGLAPEYYLIGDGKKARKIIDAITEAYDAVVDIGLL